MKSKILLVFLLPLTLALAGCNSPAQVRLDTSVEMTERQVPGDKTNEIEMVEEARSAIVGIAVDLQNGYAIGSGFAIDDGGYIVTNNHVVDGGGNITLYYADKSIGEGRVLWKDAGLDLAILSSSRSIPYLTAGESKTLRLGETVYALGTPLTLQFRHTVTKGIVSALNRTLEIEGDNGSNFLQCLVQHDASINPGNSGGPLVNAKGEVVGINTLKATEGEGIGFASPIEVASAVLTRVRQDNNFKSAYLGVFGVDSEIAEVYGQALGLEGVYVISASGPASACGLQKGDVISSFGDSPIATMQDLRISLFKYNPNDEVEIGYVRNGQNYKTVAKLAQK